MLQFLILWILFSVNVVFSQQKIAFADSEFLLNNLPSRDSVIREIEEKERGFTGELTAMDSSLNVRVGHPEHDCFNPMVRMAFENQLREQQEAIQLREKEIDDELMQLSKICNERSLDILNQAINNVAQSLSLDLVLDESIKLFSDDKLDITNAVLTEMIKIDKSMK